LPPIDLDSLTAPVSDESPAGEDLRLSAGDLTMQLVQEHRTQIEPEDDPTGAGRLVNWKGAVDECTEALRSKSKDLELAAWLTEGVTRQEGFPGLLQGLRLVAKLIEVFWDKLHPGLDEDGDLILPLRARPLNWMGNSRDFARAVSSCPILPAEGDAPALSWQDYQNSELVEEKRTLADQSQYQTLVEAGYVTGDEWQARIGAAPPSVLQEALSLIKECDAALQGLNALCESQFGEEEAPNFVALSQLLSDISEYVEQRAGDTAADSPALEESADEQVADAPAGSGGAPQPAGPISSRAEALRRLGEVADYFRRTEPHSPISYIVQRAVRWGHMPFESVIQEVVQDEGVLARIWDTLGIRPGEEPPSE
jgi:type VI secretion system protein ImpA